MSWRWPLLPRAGGGGVGRGLLALTGLGLLQAGVAVAAAHLTRRGFDLLFADSKAAGATGTVFAGLLLLAGASAALRYLETRTSEQLGHRWVQELRTALFAHLLRLSPDHPLPCREGALLLRLTGDMSALRLWLARGLARLTASGVAVAATLIALAVLVPQLALLLVAGLGLLAAMGWAAGRGLRDSARRLRRLRARLVQRMAERLRARATIAAFARELREQRRLERWSRVLLAETFRRAAAVARLRAVAEAGSYAVPALTLAFAVAVAGAAQLTPGMLLTALLLTGLFAPRLRELARVVEYASAAQVAAERVDALFALPPRRRGRRELPAGGGALQVRGLACGPLRKVSFSLPAGARAALLGPSGAGKTTLLLLLAGVRAPSAGRIRIDGEELQRLRPAARRRAVAYAGEAVPLLGEHLEDMLSYGVEGEGEEQGRLVELLAALGFPAWAEGIAAGRRVRVRPERLSAGERMRLAVIRALLARPRLLLLDEVEAGLDGELRKRLWELLAAHPGTLLFATHDRSLLHHADRVLQLADGRLREREEVRLEVVG